MKQKVFNIITLLVAVGSLSTALFALDNANTARAALEAYKSEQHIENVDMRGDIDMNASMIETLVETYANIVS